MRFLLIALTLTASAALAQTTGTVVLTLPNSTETSIRLQGDSDTCGQERIVNWAVNTTGTICGDLRFFFVAGTSCPDEPPTGTVEVDKVPQSTLSTTRTGQIRFTVDEHLPMFTGDGAVSCPAADQEKEFRLCAVFKLGNGIFPNDPCSSTSAQKDDFEVVYDALPPDAPIIESVTPLDSALSVRVDVPEDANRVKVTVTRKDGTGGTKSDTQGSGQTLFRMENLENGVTYLVTATAIDAANNESAASEAQEGTPIFTKGFFDSYVDAGGQEMGGCGAAAGGIAGGWVLAVLGFWLSSRRNRS